MFFRDPCVRHELNVADGIAGSREFKAYNGFERLDLNRVIPNYRSTPFPATTLTTLHRWERSVAR
jgi:hypothetical protein